MGTWATDAGKKPELFQQLLVFACANVFQNLSENDARQHSIPRWALLRQSMSDFLSNYPTQVADARQRVLRSFPDPTSWPAGFVDYVLAKINKPHTKIESRGMKNMTPEQVQVAIAGKRIEEYAKVRHCYIYDLFIVITVNLRRRHSRKLITALILTTPMTCPPATRTTLPCCDWCAVISGTRGASSWQTFLCGEIWLRLGRMGGCAWCWMSASPEEMPWSRLISPGCRR